MPPWVFLPGLLIPSPKVWGKPLASAVSAPHSTFGFNVEGATTPFYRGTYAQASLSATHGAAAISRKSRMFCTIRQKEAVPRLQRFSSHPQTQAKQPEASAHRYAGKKRRKKRRCSCKRILNNCQTHSHHLFLHRIRKHSRVSGKRLVSISQEEDFGVLILSDTKFLRSKHRSELKRQ